MADHAPQASLEPPRWHSALPPAGGVLGCEPEDFEVHEQRLYPCAGDGPHWHVRLWKRGWNTLDAMRAVARAAGVQDRDLGRAGLKDRWAVTTQWLSVPVGTTEPAAWELPEGLRILEAARHGQKLKPGHLASNTFRLTLSGLDVARAEALVEAIRQGGLPNWYGPQRFGKQLRNLGEAIEMLSRPEVIRGPRRRALSTLLPSVLQAEFFQRWTLARIALGTDRLVTGEYVRFAGTSSWLQIDEPGEQRMAQLASRDILLTGPLPGGRLRAQTGEALALEEEVRATFGLPEQAQRMWNDLVDGTRRDLWLWPEDLALEAVDAADKAVLRMTLPPGSFATVVLREITGGSWADPGSRRRARTQAGSPDASEEDEG
jgi:tRNA pseudouridine13 synthase